jgi:hypothetical protein
MDMGERPEGGEVGGDLFPDRRVKHMSIAQVSRESQATTMAKPASPGALESEWSFERNLERRAEFC